MSLLDVRNLSFAYGGAPVFSDVSFSLDAGEIFCPVGPNGCGKTTLLHCILGHLRPSSGAVTLAGRPLSGYRPRELAALLAYVPQTHTRAFPYRAVDVVAMGRTRFHGPLPGGPDDALAALSYMKKLGIAALAERPYTTLSGGELQTVLLCRALAQESRILVLDEPTAHLDPRRAALLLKRLAALSKSEGIAVILTAHDVNHPLLLADEGARVGMALMDRGRLSETTDPVALLSSDALQKTYGLSSRLLSVPADRERHFLAAWMEDADET